MTRATRFGRSLALPPIRRAVACSGQALSVALSSEQSFLLLVLRSSPTGTDTGHRHCFSEMDSQAVCRAGCFVHRLAERRVGVNSCLNLFKRGFEGNSEAELGN